MKKTSKIFIALVLFFAFENAIFSQTDQTWIGQDDPNAITTAAPFLIITPDSRAGAMGEAGVATSPDINSMHWNPAKFAFIENDMGVAFSYTPWLRQLGINDINISYLSGYKKFGRNERQAFASSLRYFSLGSILFTNEFGDPIRDFDPHEFSFDVGYAFQMSKYMSTGIVLRYIHSNLTGGIGIADSHPGHAVAADIATYYNRETKLFDRDAEISWGINASNIGSRITYRDNAPPNYIPINLRAGAGVKFILDEYNSILFTLDLNKLMVPTPPVYNDSFPGDPEYIIAGKNPDVAVAKGVFQSFYDAPGTLKDDGARNILQEELREINYAAGIEYIYMNQFAMRTGYFHEHQLKGNRKFFTFGFGFKMNVFGLDFSYLVPVNFQNSPLANTLRFTLSFDFESMVQTEEK